MGGSGSGRGTADEEGKKGKVAAKALRTKETNEFRTRAARQRGDRMFKVWRVHASGMKSDLGFIATPTAEAVGKTFGGGIYEVKEWDRSADKETGGVIRLAPHPGQYPIKPEFALDPHELERQAATMQHQGARPEPGSTAGLSDAEIYAKARLDLQREFADKEAQREMQRKIETLTAEITALKTNPPQQTNSLDQAAQFFDLFKKMQPPAIPNANNFNQAPDPASAMKQAIDLMTSFETFAKKLNPNGKPLVSPMGDKILGELGQVASQALRYYMSRPPAEPGAPTWPPAGPPPAGMGAPPPAAAPVRPSPVATEPPPQAVPDSELEEMQSELVSYVAKQQEDYIAGRPGASILGAARWVRNKVFNPQAAPAWRQLGAALAAHETEELLEFFIQRAPVLGETEEKRNWLAGLIDMVKARESNE